MKCLITSLRFELFENIIHMELDSTLTNNEVSGNVAIAISLVLGRSQENRSSKVGRGFHLKIVDSLKTDFP
jgi:hypothetical protein